MEAIISVIVPVYRVESYLNQCILSIVSQTYKNLEVILIDDGSPDQCGIMCEEWAKKDQRIKVIHKENGGLSDARNAGLNVASGMYIAFVDSDDFVAPTMLEQLLNVLEQESADIAECNYTCFTDERPAAAYTDYGRAVSYETKEALSLLLDESTFKYTVWNKLYRRSIFDSLRFEFGKLHEDVFFTWQVFGLCEKIAKLECSLYYYRQRNDSIMGSGFSLRNLDSLEARKRQYLYIKSRFPELSGKAQSQVLSNCLYLGQKVLRCSDPTVAEEALRRIRPLFDDVYTSQTVQETKKQKMWYYVAKSNFRGCCCIRNHLGIGL